jgi:uncharacterized protein YjbI with pentapeptide repeats
MSSTSISAQLKTELEQNQLWFDSAGASGAPAALSYEDHSHVQLANANLSGSMLQETVFASANLEKAVFIDATANGASFENAKLEHANFTKAELVESNFQSAKISHAKFVRSNLTKSNFNGASGTETIFKEANGRNVDFTDADLTRADFMYSDLSGADFSGANLSEADLSGSILSSATKFTGCKNLATIRLETVTFDGQKLDFSETRQLISRFSLLENLESLHALLLSADEKIWAEQIALLKENIERKTWSTDQVSHAVSALFGGMGTLNDLVLYKNGIPLNAENDELDRFRSVVFSDLRQFTDNQ